MQFGKQVYYRSGSLLYASIYIKWASLAAQSVKTPPARQETQVGSLGWEATLKEEIVAHSSILIWETSWTEEPRGLQPMGSQAWAVTTPPHYHTHTHIYRGLPRWLSGKESACRCKRRWLNPWVRKIPWRRK